MSEQVFREEYLHFSIYLEKTDKGFTLRIYDDCHDDDEKDHFAVDVDFDKKWAGITAITPIFDNERFKIGDQSDFIKIENGTMSVSTETEMDEDEDEDDES